MKRIKLITILTTLVITTMLFTGCKSETEKKVTLDVVGTEPITIATMETNFVTEPTESQFEFGQQIWIVDCEDNNVWLSRYAVVGQRDNGLIEAVPYFTNDIEQLKEVLDCNEHIRLIDADCIYEDKYEAMAAVAAASNESFEEYWGTDYWADTDDE